MSYSQKICFLGVIVSLLTQSCGKAGDSAAYTPPVIQNPVLQNGSVCPNGTLLSYENFGESFMLNYCTSCHARDLSEAARSGAPELLHLDRPGDMAQWRAKMITTAATASGGMPPAANVPARDRQKLAEWLSCGAPAETDSVLGASDE